MKVKEVRQIERTLAGSTCAVQDTAVCVTVEFEVCCVRVMAMECVLLLFVQQSYRVFSGFSY